MNTSFTAGRDPSRRRGRRCAALVFAAALAGAGCTSVPRAVAPLDATATTGVKAGQSRDQVRALLGAPADTINFASLGEEVWAYKIVDASQAKPRRNFYVYFDDRTGAVRRTEALSDGDYDTGCGTGRN